MKATIKKTDGTVIEIEGTAEEVAKVIGAPLPSVQLVPYWVPTPQPTLPIYPTYPIWYGVGDIVCSNAAANAGCAPTVLGPAGALVFNS